ncbi:MAG: flagellar biosynthesis protein FlhF [Roseburia sp.]|nr:flagellar biosynthesis protein FlhF [Ruminococcus sp.]MCM1155919.1 flagellar biosynthesis protein FlhF [Roseburia sp.]MCM1243765.1 flagellar biosynthesis protein FlhF [Roseburia sp.]
MIIKKFLGKTEAEAIENAKKELGANVVVMNVRNAKRKGLFDFLKPQMVEVTVALEEEAPVSEDPVSADVKAAVSAINDVVVSSINNAQAAQPEPRQSAGLLGGQEEFAAKGGFDKKENNAIEERLDSLQSLLEQQLQKPEEEKKEEEKREEPVSETDKFMKLLHSTMIENEVDETYAGQIIEEIEKINKPNSPFDFALANTYQKMILKFGKPVGITPSEKGVKVIFFVGPTGVGKTTTIAKIASRFQVDDKKKVALLTADTYRIAAAEQLRTYANILEVPFRIVYAIEEVEQALIDFKDYDYILVDTAGHSYQNTAQKENMSRFIHSVDGLVEKEVFLVLSATTKYKDLISIADAYKEMADYKLIFTKLDETTTLGNLLNLKLYTGAPLSYVTHGQNVPDDIENFNPQKTVKRLLGGKS